MTPDGAGSKSPGVVGYQQVILLGRVGDDDGNQVLIPPQSMAQLLEQPHR